jgi:3,4-dihydroxy-2-butanone 4-phosphate synthase
VSHNVVVVRVQQSPFVITRFFERMAKTSRKDKWGRILRPILVMWYECAKRLGETELCVRLLMEMISSGALCEMMVHSRDTSLKHRTLDTVTPEERALLVKDLKELFKVN